MLLGPDTSFYDGTPDFNKMKSAGASYVIVRVGQNVWPDSKFNSSWIAAKQAGLPRGSYWFYDSRVSPKVQADIAISMLKDDPGELPLFADFEEYYNGQYSGYRPFQDFLGELKRGLPQTEIGIYTAPYYWIDHVPASARDSFVSYPLWIANYEVLVPKIPSPWGANSWLFWQFTEKGDGIKYGVESNALDLNYFNGDAEAFRLRFNLDGVGSNDPPIGETMIETVFAGNVKHITGRLNDQSDISCWVIPRNAIDKFELYPPDGCRLPENVIGDADICGNFVPFSPGCKPNLGTRVDGIEYQIYDGISQGSYSPFFWTSNSSLIIDHRIKAWKNLGNSLQGLRYLVQGGFKNPNSSNAWNIRESRRAIGRLPDGSTVWFANKKGNGNAGLTIHEVAEYMLSLGCDYVIDGDGGRSLRDAVRINGQVQVFSGEGYPDGNAAGIKITLKEKLSTDATPPPPPPPTESVPYILDVEGYKPVSGVLEPDA